jgi:uncharacterized protein YndB with AHSA1/START domain
MADVVNERIERVIELKASPARVWRALVDHEEFGQWFGVKLQSPFVVGQATCGNITYPGYEHIVMEVVVRSMEPQKRFAFTWHPYAIDANTDYSKEEPTLVEFTLEKSNGGTRLTVTESGFGKIPAWRRDEAFRMNSGGWTEQIKNIHAHLEKNH